MNNNSSLQELANGLAGLLGNNIFPAIVKGLKDTRGIDITAEELYKWSNLPMNRSLMPAMTFGGAVPNPVSTTSTTTTAAAKKKAGAGAKEKVELKVNSDGTPQTSTGKPFIVGKSCRHFYEKGAVNQGKYCGRDVVKGTDFCSNKTHKDKENKQKPTVGGVAPSVEVAEPEEENGGLQVRWYDKDRFLYEETTHHFIILQKEDDEQATSMGKLYPDNTIKPLTENEKVIARALGITVPDIDLNDLISESKTPVAQVPMSVPQMPIPVAQVPMSVPQMPMPVAQVPMSVPQVPMSVPQMPMSVPQMPMPVAQIPMSVPQVPMSVPQMPMSVPQMPMPVAQGGPMMPRFPGTVPK